MLQANIFPYLCLYLIIQSLQVAYLTFVAEK